MLKAYGVRAMSLENTASQIDEEEFVDELKPGTKLMLGQYTIEGFLAAGGFGITYLAKDSLDRRVVIKECFPGSFCRRQNTSVTPRSRAHQNELKSIVRMFSQEAMSLAKANHPNIVGVHQVFEENNTAYMALDYVHGRDLLEILEEDPDSLKPELVEGYLKKVLGAIGHIHELGMLHRDISPDNIIIDENGEPKLIDFGAARESRNEKVTRMLSALRVVKDGYSPQEFYIAGSDQGPSCDLYSLAASFYHLITKELPPDSQWRLSACAAGDDDPYVPLGDKTDAYSKRFTTALDKAMAILPRDRMENAEEWLQHMEDGASAVASKPAPMAAPAAAANTDKKPGMAMLLGGTALAAAAGIGYFVFTGSEPTETAAVPAPASEAVATVEEPTAPVEAPVSEASNEFAATLPSEEPTPIASEPAEPETGTETALIPEAPVAAPTEESVGDVLAATPETAEVVLEEFAASENVSVNIAELTTPASSEDALASIPASIVALPEQLSAPLPRPALTMDVALAAARISQPIVDTAPPEAPVVVAQETAPAAPEAPAAPATETSAVDFFVSMAKSQPELVSSRTRNQPAAPVERPAPAAQETTAVPSVITRFVPTLPFELSGWQQGVVSSVEEGAPSWLTSNMRIVSVNGDVVRSNAEIQSKLESLTTANADGTIDVTFGVDTGLNTAVTERTIPLGTEKHTMLLNGLRFVSRETDAGWTTVVVEAPSASNFAVGDQLVSYVATWEDLDGPNSLQTILERELASGTSTFSFAVSRDGEIWVEAFNLASLGN